MGALVGIVAMIVNTLGGLDRVPPRADENSRGSERLIGFALILVRLPAAAPPDRGEASPRFIQSSASCREFISFKPPASATHRLRLSGFRQSNHTACCCCLVLVMIVNGALAAWEKRLHRRFGTQ